MQAPKQSLSKEEKALVVEGAMPAQWKPAKRRQKDLDARWTKKHVKSYFGYKVSANADARYKLVRKFKVSTAREHDTLHFEDVLDSSNTNHDILADKGYVDQEREARLSELGWRMHIQRKGHQNKPISGAQQRRNHRIAKPAPASSMCLPGWRSWAAKPCARGCSSTGKSLSTICSAWSI